MDTRISSLSYIKLKRLDIDIKTAFQELVQMMKLKENQEKSVTSRYRTRMHNKNSVCMERNSSTLFQGGSFHKHWKIPLKNAKSAK